MTDLNYDDAPFAIRDDLTTAHRGAWERLSSPGTWLTAGTRVAIIAEVRNVKGCALCRQRKDALSPYSVAGEHDSLGDLPENIVEVIHRVVSDPARLMKKWYDDCLASGLSEEEYVEIIGVVCSTVSIDTFARAAGLPLRELPSPKPGEPTRIRPHNAKPGWCMGVVDWPRRCRGGRHSAVRPARLEYSARAEPGAGGSARFHGNE